MKGIIFFVFGSITHANGITLTQKIGKERWDTFWNGFLIPLRRREIGRTKLDAK